MTVETQIKYLKLLSSECLEDAILAAKLLDSDPDYKSVVDKHKRKKEMRYRFDKYLLKGNNLYIYWTSVGYIIASAESHSHYYIRLSHIIELWK